MRKNSAVVLFLLTLTACGGGGQDTNSGSATQSTDSDSGCGNNPCEARARYKKPPGSGGGNTSSDIKLSTQEQASLNAALGAPSSHIHADANKGQIVFSSDNAAEAASASHITGNESEISLAEGGASRKVVTTPAASDLLQRRRVR
jgi:hypothetical protein